MYTLTPSPLKKGGGVKSKLRLSSYTFITNNIDIIYAIECLHYFLGGLCPK